MIHLPILRHGNQYKSLDIARVPHHQTRELFVEVSQANAGLIRRDLSKQNIGTDALSHFSTRDLVDICSRAGDIFTNDSLPLGQMFGGARFDRVGDAVTRAVPSTGAAAGA